jgi:hypothetical protein
VNTASASKGRYPRRALRKEPTDFVGGQRSRLALGSPARQLVAVKSQHRVLSHISTACRKIEHAAQWGDDPANRPRREPGPAHRADEPGELISRDLLDLPFAEHRDHVEVECAPVSLEGPLRSLTRGHECPEGREKLLGDGDERELRRRRDLATPLLPEELIPLRLRLGPRPCAERLHPHLYSLRAHARARARTRDTMD